MRKKSFMQCTPYTKTQHISGIAGDSRGTFFYFKIKLDMKRNITGSHHLFPKFRLANFHFAVINNTWNPMQQFQENKAVACCQC